LNIAFLLPLASFLTTLFAILTSRSNPGWRESFLFASIIWGAFQIIAIEVLGVFDSIGLPGLVLFWTIHLIIVMIILQVRGSNRVARLREALIQLRNTWSQFALVERITVIAIGLIVFALFFVAWISPPNTIDSLLYHMSRVVHWAQNGSLAHYPTAYEHQLYNPPWSETAILALRTLWGDDRPANLVQWFSMLASLVGVSAIAGSMGVGRRGQILSVAFVATVPMGILQATSSQTDYVTSFWLVSLAYFAAVRLRRPLRAPEIALLGTVMGLGLLTKGTFIIYALPFMLVYLILTVRQEGIRQVMSQLAGIGALAFVLNLGFWARNMATYGFPYGSKEFLEGHISVQIAANSESDSSKSINRSAGWLRWTGEQLIKTAAQQMVTPVRKLNLLMGSGLNRAYAYLGMSPTNDFEIAIWNYEDTAGSPLHFALVPIALLGMVGMASGESKASAIALAAALAAGWFLFALLIPQSSALTGVRLQLPVLIVFGPVVGASTVAIGKRKFFPFAAVLLILAGLPYVIFNHTRPLIGRLPWTTRVESILKVRPVELLFAANPSLLATYEPASLAMANLQCNQIGLRIDSHDTEYAIWWLLEAPQSGVELRSIYTYPRLLQYQDRSFKPCAIMCTICGDRSRLHGLDLIHRSGFASVFAGSTFDWDADR
jgi:hypothetical protein